MRVRHRYEKARLKQYPHRRGTCTIALKLKILAYWESVCRGGLAALSLVNGLETVVEKLDVSAYVPFSIAKASHSALKGTYLLPWIQCR